MKVRALIVSLLLFLTAFQMKAGQDIRVRILKTKTITTAKIKVFSGTYQLQDSVGNTRALFNKGDSVTIRHFNNELILISPSDTFFCGNTVRLRSVGFLNIFQLFADNSTRLYDDDLLISLREDKTLWLINEVELEHYVAGVVQAEAGIAKNGEFYKVQAVAVRTYTLQNLEKHAEEGYQLCDQTCCQVYKGRCANTEIMISTSKTAGQVLTDTAGNLITAVFHSNSGGQTANSEDVWGKSLPYLRSVNDPYSVSQTSYSWTKTLSKSEWLDYLKKNFNYPVSDAREVAKVTHFTQSSRQVFLTGNIGLRKIREDLGLRSTFFDISEQGDKVVFSGRGFGHGVGLSQEGAINMARQGFSYTDILKYYYLGIRISTLDELEKTP